MGELVATRDDQIATVGELVATRDNRIATLEEEVKQLRADITTGIANLDTKIESEVNELGEKVLGIFAGLHGNIKDAVSGHNVTRYLPNANNKSSFGARSLFWAQSLVSRTTGMISPLACTMTALAWIYLHSYMFIMSPTLKAALSTIIVGALSVGIVTAVTSLTQGFRAVNGMTNGFAQEVAREEENIFQPPANEPVE